MNIEGCLNCSQIVMKRGTIADEMSGREETGEVTRILTQYYSSDSDSDLESFFKILTPYSGSSFSDLPRDILLNILLRLSVRWIFVFKCVCKTWYDLVSDPDFAKLHLDQAEVCPLIRRFQSRMVYLVQPDPDDLELKLGMCDHTYPKSGCVCNIRVKLDTEFEIPRGYALTKYNILTCNGLLCLSRQSDKRLGPLVVCNPITGEFISLPKPEKNDFNMHNVCYGFGFSPLSKQYKVIRMSPNKPAEADIHILGTKTWKNISFITRSMPELSPTYLNGFLYWCNQLQPLSICTFDVEKESFGAVSAPTLNQPYQYNSMGVLEGELCICAVLESGDINVWTMKDNGTILAWSKVFSFDHIFIGRIHTYVDFGSLIPIKYLNGGSLLMFYSLENAFVYVDPKENRLRYLKVKGAALEVETIAYTPSFISLKHVLSGQNMKVLNVKTRCAKLKVHKDTDIEIVEEKFHNYDDYNYYDDHDGYDNHDDYDLDFGWTSGDFYDDDTYDFWNIM